MTKEEVGRAIEVDVSDRHIYVASDVFLSLELVKDLGPGGLMFSAGFFGNRTFYRKTSQGAWQSTPRAIVLGFNATISQEK